MVDILVAPYFMTNGDKMEAVLDDAYILLTDKKIANMEAPRKPNWLNEVS